MNNSTKPQSNTINPQNNNKNVENFIKSTTTGIRFVKGKYDYIKFLINNTPIQIKILNIIIKFTGHMFGRHRQNIIIHTKSTSISFLFKYFFI
jgi:hypothetical protein